MEISQKIDNNKAKLGYRERDKLYQKETLSREFKELFLEIYPERHSEAKSFKRALHNKFMFGEHHQSHAGSAFFPSSFEVICLPSFTNACKAKRFEPTNTEKLEAFYSKHDPSKTKADVQKIIEQLVPSDTSTAESLMKRLKSKYGDSPHIFFDDQLSIDAIAGEHIEVFGPESTL